MSILRPSLNEGDPLGFTTLQTNKGNLSPLETTETSALKHKLKEVTKRALQELPHSDKLPRPPTPIVKHIQDSTGTLPKKISGIRAWRFPIPEIFHSLFEPRVSKRARSGATVEKPTISPSSVGSTSSVEKKKRVVQERANVTKTAKKTDNVVKKDKFKEMSIKIKDDKGNDVEHKVTLKFLAKGKAKEIWAAVMPKDMPDGSFREFLNKNIFISAVSNSKKKEIIDEVGLSKSMIKEFQRIFHRRPEHLHVDFDNDLIAKAGGVEELLIAAPKAYCDLEKLIQDPALTRMDRLKLVRDVVKAVKELHALGVVAGDLKPENFLVFKQPNGEYIVKLSDFGKSKKLDNNTAFYTGNTRFGPRNGRLNKNADIESLVGVIARILEEECLPKSKKDEESPPPMLSLLENYKQDKYPAANIRRGFERYKTENAVFNAVETLMEDPKTGQWVGRNKVVQRYIEGPRRLKIAAANDKQQQAEKNAVNGYLGTLAHALISADSSSKDDTEGVVQLLKEMNGNEKERPSMDEVDKRFEVIFNAVEKREANKTMASETIKNEENLVKSVIKMISPLTVGKSDLISLNDLGRDLYNNLKKSDLSDLGKIAESLIIWKKNKSLQADHPEFQNEVNAIIKSCFENANEDGMSFDKLKMKIQTDMGIELTSDQRKLLVNLFELVYLQI